MSKKKMTGPELKAVDWAALWARVVEEAPSAARFIYDLVNLLLAPQGGKCPDPCPCPEALADACDAECEAVVQLVIAHVKLHSLIACDPCPLPESQKKK